MMTKINFPASYVLHVTDFVKETPVSYMDKDEDGNEVERKFNTYSLQGLLMTKEYGEDRATVVELTVDNSNRYERKSPLTLTTELFPQMAKLMTGEKLLQVEVDHIFMKRGGKDKVALNTLIPYVKDIAFIDATKEDREFIEVMTPLM